MTDQREPLAAAVSPSCKVYKPGPQWHVPGRKGMRWTEADWIDDEATDHRRDDE